MEIVMALWRIQWQSKEINVYICMFVCMCCQILVYLHYPYYYIHSHQIYIEMMYQIHKIINLLTHSIHNTYTSNTLARPLRTAPHRTASSEKQISYAKNRTKTSNSLRRMAATYTCKHLYPTYK